MAAWGHSRRHVLCLALSLLLIPVAVTASTRAEQWAKLREEKRQKLVPNRIGTPEKVLLAIEKGGAGLSYKGLYPRFETVTTGSGPGINLRYWKQHFLSRQTDLQVIGAYTTRSYQVYNVQAGKIMQRGLEPLMGSGGSGGLSAFHGLRKRDPRDFFLYGDFRYTHYPQEDYFGLGTDSSEDNRTNYLMESTMGSVVGGVRVGGIVVLGGGVGYMKQDIRQGEDERYPDIRQIFDDTTAPGLDSQPDFLSMSGVALVDYRDRPGNPHKGGMVGFQFHRYNDRGGENFEFSRYTFDARHYLSLGSEQRVLAMRFLSSFDVPDDEARVPFYLQESLGGGEILRGFENYRFRDLNRLYMSGEYRWEAAPALELALFYDTGKVFADRSDFNFSDLQDSYGFGVRFKLPESTFLRIDAAFGGEGTKVYLKFGVASF